MRQREISTFSKRVTILVGLGVVGAMAFGLAISFYRNLLFEETLASLTERNRDLRDSIDKGLESLAYYRSSQYRDKYAKENLAKLSAGEKVLILKPLPEAISFEADDDTTRAEQRAAAYVQYLQKLPVIEHWKLYFLEPEKLTELKQSF